MSEFRQDIISHNWILIAEGRGKRPEDFKSAPATEVDLPEVSPTCSFCPGQEDQTPPEICRYPKKGEWEVRVVPNKYEALGHGKIKQPLEKNFYVSRPGIGDHEIVIMRKHNLPTALQSVETIDLTLQAYIDRILELKKHKEVRYVHIIQNHGVKAGSSLMHPHSQIFAVPFLPDRLQDELSATRTYYNLHGKCVYCQILEHELKEKERIILETPEYVVMTPYASKVPYQIRIVPKMHHASFEEISIQERKGLARVLKDIFGRLYRKLDNPAYNYYVHTYPFDGDALFRSHNDLESYHWHIVIMPRINVWAGFELGTEIYVNTLSPESAAEFLRKE